MGSKTCDSLVDVDAGFVPLLEERREDKSPGVGAWPFMRTLGAALRMRVWMNWLGGGIVRLYFYFVCLLFCCVRRELTEGNGDEADVVTKGDVLLELIPQRVCAKHLPLQWAEERGSIYRARRVARCRLDIGDPLAPGARFSGGHQP